MKTCLDCGATAAPERLWCEACSSTALSLDVPHIVHFCPICAETWPSRLLVAQERGIPVSVLCAAHIAEMRQEAATRVAVVA
jgi:hypothetical protein